MKKRPILQRFWEKVDKKSDNECWNWLAYCTPFGHGQFCIRHGHYIHAHRFSYMLFYKINPKDLKVCHSCDNPSCVNPKHLFLGTQRDNMEDMINKGRGKLPPPPPRGEKNHATKLTEDKVLEIVHLYKSGEKKSDLAKRYKVTTQAIYLILKGENWNHVTKIKHVQQEGLI